MYLIFDIGGTNIRAAVADRENIVYVRKTVWPRELSPADEVQFIAQEGMKTLQAAGLERRPEAVGMSLPALTDGRGTVVIWPNRPSWTGLRVKDLLESALQVPVLLEDDGNAAALGEHTFGVARGYRDFVMIMAGTGIGAGLILNGALFRGRHGWAGEIGHMTMIRDGNLCACGRAGCLQLLASGRALDQVALARNLTSAQALKIAAESGQEWARNTVANAATWLGLAIANICTLLDLEAAVIGGSLTKLGSMWWDVLQSTVNHSLLGPLRASFELRESGLSDKSGLFGALSLAIAAGVKNQEKRPCRRK